MTHEIEIQDAVDELHSLQAEREVKQGRVRALIGDGNGNLVGANGVPWVLCRLHADTSQLVQAYNGTPLTPSEGMSVTLLIKYTEGRVDHYEVEKLSNDVPYAGYEPGATGGVAAHHLSHEGTDGGGWDMVNVYPLNMTMGRVNAQATPDLTLSVAPLYYYIAGVLYYYPGGVSPAFTPPGSGSRYDVLTLDDTGTLNIEVGALTLPPIAFAIPANRVPLAAVLLTVGQTSITDDDLYDVRPFLSVSDLSAITSGAFALTSVLTPPTLATNQNNYNPTGLATAAVVRLSASVAVSITGLAGGTSGRLLFLHNVGANAIVLKDESASSSAANRFALVANITLAPDAVALLQYDTTDARWRAIAGGGGSAQWSVLTNGDATTPELIFAGGDVVMVETF